MRSVPGMASESSVEVGLAPRSAALQAIHGITGKLCIRLTSWRQEWMQSENGLMYDYTVHVSINVYDKHARQQKSIRKGTNNICQPQKRYQG